MAELTALMGGRVVGEHRHPGLVARFTVLQGELTVKLNDQTSILRTGESCEVRPGEWHDCWNPPTGDAWVWSEVTPGERFMHMIETLSGLVRLDHTDQQGMPNMLELAMTGREFSDVIQFCLPPLLAQKTMGVCWA